MNFYSKLRRIDWTVSIFLIVTHLAAVSLVPWYLVSFGVPWGIVCFSFLFAAATNLSITSGYHRHFSHQSYDAHPVVQALFLLIGASSFQGSALKWSSDHRIHHKFMDTDRDPYSISKGFFFAHMGWLFLVDSIDKNPKAPDLEANRMVQLQHKYYVPIAIATGFLLPALVGYWMGSTISGFLLGGVARIAFTQQTTFFINSICHTFGKRTYSLEGSARDSYWIAFLTHGEGYHNFHHKFPYDYRNAIRWYQWDPTRWTISILNKFGLAYNLKVASKYKILKARLLVESHKIASKGYAEEFIEKTHQKLLTALTKLEASKQSYHDWKKDLQLQRSDAIASVRARRDMLVFEIKLRRIEFQALRKEWRLYLQAPCLNSLEKS